MKRKLRGEADRKGICRIADLRGWVGGGARNQEEGIQTHKTESVTPDEVSHYFLSSTAVSMATHSEKRYLSDVRPERGTERSYGKHRVDVEE